MMGFRAEGCFDECEDSEDCECADGDVDVETPSPRNIVGEKST